jgi:alkane 1-monooxygenase
MPLRYLSPFAFLALLPLGGWLGGAWTFMAAAATPVCLVGLDWMLGGEGGGERRREVPRWVPRLYVLLQLAADAWAAGRVMRPETSLLEAVGLAVSAGVTMGVFGFLAAHEMIHSWDRRERGLGLLLLGSVFYMHFRIAHVHGHHRRAATKEDPASARLGEGLYAFLLRSIAGQAREAWAFEAERLRNRKLPVRSCRNRMILYSTVEAALLLSLALVSWRAAAFVVAVAALAVVLLEAFNYIAHYGLTRRVASGRVERLAPHHSWNSCRRMNNVALFNMGRHSNHHTQPARRYDGLEAIGGEAELPFGYAGAILTALVPPIWRRVMDERAVALFTTRVPHRHSRNSALRNPL